MLSATKIHVNYVSISCILPIFTSRWRTVAIRWHQSFSTCLFLEIHLIRMLMQVAEWSALQYGFKECSLHRGNSQIGDYQICSNNIMAFITVPRNFGLNNWGKSDRRHHQTSQWWGFSECFVIHGIISPVLQKKARGLASLLKKLSRHKFLILTVRICLM